ncbi:MAG: sulfurtransferase [Henriciella sp.]|nr:sulfurtransferase [Henriciella sp.]
MSGQDPLVTADWLQANIAAPDLRVVDATWVPGFLVGRKTGIEEYNDGHIPGAVFFDIDDIADPDATVPHMLPDAIRFSSKVRKLGLGDGQRIIVYDANGFFASARAWWMLRAMGHKDVHVLDGGRSAWVKSGGELEDLPPVPVERHFTARKRTDLVKTMDQMHDLSSAGNVSILDARTQGRFDGTDPEPRKDLPSGHMPGSFCVPSGSLLNADGTMKSATDLLPLLQPHVSGPVVTSCGSGVSAAIISLALARLGNWDAALYDGSWTEWASHADNPIERA